MESRQMPHIIPEEIIPWLMDRNLWPDIPKRKITRYWNHLCDVRSEIANVSPDGSHHPLWIWADAANYIKDQNIIVICFGSVLDDETDSIKKCFPLVLCREESCKYLHFSHNDPEKNGIEDNTTQKKVFQPITPRK